MAQYNQIREIKRGSVAEKKKTKLDGRRMDRTGRLPLVSFVSFLVSFLPGSRKIGDA